MASGRLLEVTGPMQAGLPHRDRGLTQEGQLQEQGVEVCCRAVVHAHLAEGQGCQGS